MAKEIKVHHNTSFSKPIGSLYVCVAYKKPDAKPDEYDWVFLSENGSVVPPRDEAPFMPYNKAMSVAKKFNKENPKLEAEIFYEFPA